MRNCIRGLLLSFLSLKSYIFVGPVGVKSKSACTSGNTVRNWSHDTGIYSRYDIWTYSRLCTNAKMEVLRWTVIYFMLTTEIVVARGHSNRVSKLICSGGTCGNSRFKLRFVVCNLFITFVIVVNIIILRPRQV